MRLHRHNRALPVLLLLACAGLPLRAAEPPPAPREAPGQPAARAANSLAARVQGARALAADGRWADVVITLTPVERTLAAPDALLLVRALRQTAATDQAARTLDRARRRWPDDLDLLRAGIDLALDRGQNYVALQDARRLRARVGDHPDASWCLAQALLALGPPLASAQVRHVPGGRAGQFCGGWLLLEARAGAEQFLCCPEESAPYQLRRALDGGCDEPRAHLAHAQVWSALLRHDLALRLVRAHEAALLATGDAATPAAMAQIAIDAGRVDLFLRYVGAQAALRPADRPALLAAAYARAAEHYAREGEMRLHVEFLHRAIRERPDDTHCLLLLADAEWDAERFTAARRTYAQLLERDPLHAQRLRIAERLAGD